LESTLNLYPFPAARRVALDMDPPLSQALGTLPVVACNAITTMWQVRSRFRAKVLAITAKGTDAIESEA